MPPKIRLKIRIPTIELSCSDVLDRLLFLHKYATRAPARSTIRYCHVCTWSKQWQTFLHCGNLDRRHHRPDPAVFCGNVYIIKPWPCSCSAQGGVLGVPTNQPKDTATSSHSQGIPKGEGGNVASQRGHEVHRQKDVPAEHLLYGRRYCGQGIAGAGQVHKGVVHKVCCDQPAPHPSHCEILLQHLTYSRTMPWSCHCGEHTPKRRVCQALAVPRLMPCTGAREAADLACSTRQPPPPRLSWQAPGSIPAAHQPRRSTLSPYPQHTPPH